MLISYAVERGWVVYDIYSDDDYSGADRDRPAFKRLIRDAEDRKFDIVLCKSQSRFTRELELVEKYLHHLFPLWGIRFVSIVDNADTEVKGNKKSRQINGLINEWYIEDLSEDIKKVLTDKRKKGLHIGAFVRYGYQKDPNRKGHIIIDEEAAQVVREIFTLYASGYGKHTIARLLNARGIPNPTTYKQLKGIHYQQSRHQHSPFWSYHVISETLVNEIYRGHMVQGRVASISYKTQKSRKVPKDKWLIVKNTHEPIISEQLWNTVQALNKHTAKPCSTGIVSIFAGKAKCQHCGYALKNQRKSNSDSRYLTCTTRLNRSVDACPGTFIAVKTLEQNVLEQLQGILKEFLNEEETEQQIRLRSSIEEQQVNLRSSLATYEQKNAEYSKGIKELYLDKTRGILTEGEFLHLQRELSKDKEKVAKLITATQDQISSLESKKSTTRTRRDILEKYKETSSLDRVMIVELIDTILIGKRNPETKKWPIEIKWSL
jgi:DNA invertase Pin-like site-specific DNA recombinase